MSGRGGVHRNRDRLGTANLLLLHNNCGTLSLRNHLLTATGKPTDKSDDESQNEDDEAENGSDSNGGLNDSGSQPPPNDGEDDGEDQGNDSDGDSGRHCDYILIASKIKFHE